MTTLFGQEHVERYLQTDGEDGYHWLEDTTILLLTTAGAKSGRSYTHALIYREHGADYLIVASKGGAEQPPSWYVNLSANPDVQLQIKGEKFAARARTATAGEKPELWSVMTQAWPAYDEYQTKTTRDIPVVVLERTQGA